MPIWPATGARSGAMSVGVDRRVNGVLIPRLSTALIGHLIDNGVYASGDTLIGVNGVLTTDDDSEFRSAPQGTGELRIYLTAVADDQVNPGARLNGEWHGDDQGPNNQGVF